MKVLTNVNEEILIDEDGLYEYEVKNVSSLEIKILENVKAQLIITYQESLNLNRHVELEKNAKLNLLHVNATSVSDVDEKIDLMQDAELICGYYELNKNNSKLNLKAYLKEEGATINILTSTLTNDNDKYYNIDCIHEVAHTYSDMRNFAISDKNANYEMIACGRILKGAKQSKSFQSTKVLTSNDNQTSKVTPLLLIDENDVMASHANSLGQMNEEHLYYLMSRGLNRLQASGLLTLAYMLPLAEIINDEEIHERIEKMIRSRVGL